MSVRFLQRSDTAANWTSANPILGDGEIGYVSDELYHKVGDGVTPWVSLPEQFPNHIREGDSRLSDARTPTSHTHTLSDVTDAGTAAEANVPISGDAGTAEVVLGSDSRLSDSRTPTAHTHTLADVVDAGSAAGSNTEDFDPAGTATTAVSTHVSQANPHTQYLQDAPQDGSLHARQDGAWVPFEAGGSGGVDSSAIDALRTELMGEINYLSAQLKILPSYIAPHLFPYSFSVVPNETAWVHGIPPVEVDLPTLPPVTMYAPLGPYTAPSE